MKLPDSPNLPPDMPRLIRQLTTLWRQLADWTRTLGVDSLVNGSVPTWDATLGQFVAGTGGGMTNPMTTVGDLIVGGTSGTPTRVAAGTATYVWTANGAGVAPTWQASSGSSDIRDFWLMG